MIYRAILLSRGMRGRDSGADFTSASDSWFPGLNGSDVGVICRSSSSPEVYLNPGTWRAIFACPKLWIAAHALC